MTVTAPACGGSGSRTAPRPAAAPAVTGAFVEADQVWHRSVADPEWRLSTHDERQQHAHDRRDSNPPRPADEERDYGGNQ